MCVWICFFLFYAAKLPLLYKMKSSTLVFKRNRYTFRGAIFSLLILEMLFPLYLHSFKSQFSLGTLVGASKKMEDEKVYTQ